MHKAFVSPAVLGATPLGVQVAAIFANAGQRVRLYDRPDAEEPNRRALDAINSFCRVHPSPLSGGEALMWMEARNFRDHWGLLGEHDLLFDCLDDDLCAKQDLWLRLAPALSTEALLLSYSLGLSIQAIATALPSSARARFMGVHFFRPTRFHRLVEIIPTAHTDPKVQQKFADFCAEEWGYFPLTAPDRPNYLCSRLMLMLAHIACHHAQVQKLGRAEFEALTRMMMSRPPGGLLALFDLIGIERWCTTAARIDVQERDRFAPLSALPPCLDALQKKGHLGRDARLGFFDYRARPFLLRDDDGNPCPPARLPENLQALFDRRDWQALNADGRPAARFVAHTLRDWWQYGVYFSRDTGTSGEDIDRILRYGFSWQEGIFGLLQDFSPAEVLQTTQEATLPYPVLKDWGRKLRREKNRSQNAHCTEARLLKHYSHSDSLLWRECALIWQPKRESTALSAAVLQELIAACQYARQNGLSLLLCHHGQFLGTRSDFEPFSPKMSEKNHAALCEAVVQLRMHAKPVLMSLSGMLSDFALALVVQADQVVFDANLRWQLFLPRQGFLPAGAVWFEWLRRLPSLSHAQTLEQIRAVLFHICEPHPPGSVHTLRQMGLLRSVDRIVANPEKLVAETEALLAANAAFAGPRARRYSVEVLSAGDCAQLLHYAEASAHPDLYRELVALLGSQSQNMTVSLRMLLAEERQRILPKLLHAEELK